MKSILAAAAILALSGCASVMNDVTNGMRIDTRTAAGETVDGAECVVTNDYGSATVKSGLSQAVRRSSKDLEISCTHPGQPAATGKAISRANAALAGNIIIGGVIGAVVDHNRGTAYTYPTWIEMVFGKSLVFDRMHEKEGMPLKGTLASALPPSPVLGSWGASSNACQHLLAGAVCDAGAGSAPAQKPRVAYTPQRHVGGVSADSQACLNQLPGAVCPK